MRRTFGAVVLVLLTASLAFAVLGGGDVLFKVSGAGNVLFTHDNHAGRSRIGCKECHYAIFTNRAGHRTATMEDMRSGRSCGACHNGIRAFNVASPDSCSRCHQ